MNPPRSPVVFLVDDCPEVAGVLVPTWEHIIFDAPYNATAAGRRLNWVRRVLDDVQCSGQVFSVL